MANGRREDDERWHDYHLYLSWGWTMADAAFAAYYGKPFTPHQPVRPSWIYGGA